MGLPLLLSETIVPIFKPIPALSHGFKDSCVLKLGHHFAGLHSGVFSEFSMRRIASAHIGHREPRGDVLMRQDAGVSDHLPRHLAMRRWKTA